jgi:hypothetical protein
VEVALDDLRPVRAMRSRSGSYRQDKVRALVELLQSQTPPDLPPILVQPNWMWPCPSTNKVCVDHRSAGTHCTCTADYKWILRDGYNRLEAAEQLGHQSILAWVHWHVVK